MEKQAIGAAAGGGTPLAGAPPQTSEDTTGRAPPAVAHASEAGLLHLFEVHITTSAMLLSTKPKTDMAASREGKPS